MSDAGELDVEGVAAVAYLGAEGKLPGALDSADLLAPALDDFGGGDGQWAVFRLDDVEHDLAGFVLAGGLAAPGRADRRAAGHRHDVFDNGGAAFALELITQLLCSSLNLFDVGLGNREGGALLHAQFADGALRLHPGHVDLLDAVTQHHADEDDEDADKDRQREVAVVQGAVEERLVDYLDEAFEAEGDGLLEPFEVTVEMSQRPDDDLREKEPEDAADLVAQ